MTYLENKTFRSLPNALDHVIQQKRRMTEKCADMFENNRPKEAFQAFIELLRLERKAHKMVVKNIYPGNRAYIARAPKVRMKAKPAISPDLIDQMQRRESQTRKRESKKSSVRRLVSGLGRLGKRAFGGIFEQIGANGVYAVNGVNTANEINLSPGFFVSDEYEDDVFTILRQRWRQKGVRLNDIDLRFFMKYEQNKQLSRDIVKGFDEFMALREKTSVIPREMRLEGSYRINSTNINQTDIYEREFLNCYLVHSKGKASDDIIDEGLKLRYQNLTRMTGNFGDPCYNKIPNHILRARSRRTTLLYDPVEAMKCIQEGTEYNEQYRREIKENIRKSEMRVIFTRTLKGTFFYNSDELEKEMESVEIDYELYIYRHESDDETFLITIVIPVLAVISEQEANRASQFDGPSPRTVDLCMYSKALEYLLFNGKNEMAVSLFEKFYANFERSEYVATILRKTFSCFIKYLHFTRGVADFLEMGSGLEGFASRDQEKLLDISFERNKVGAALTQMPYLLLILESLIYYPVTNPSRAKFYMNKIYSDLKVLIRILNVSPRMDKPNDFPDWDKQYVYMSRLLLSPTSFISTTMMALGDQFMRKNKQKTVYALKALEDPFLSGCFLTQLFLLFCDRYNNARGEKPYVLKLVNKQKDGASWRKYFPHFVLDLRCCYGLPLRKNLLHRMMSMIHPSKIDSEKEREMAVNLSLFPNLHKAKKQTDAQVQLRIQQKIIANSLFS